MSSSCIQFRERHIESLDAAMEVWLRLIVAAIDTVRDPAPWLVAAREDWNEAATMGAGFGVIPELDSIIDNEERRKVVLELCETASRRLRDLGDPIPATTLNALGAGPPDSWFTREVPAEIFTTVAAQFTELIREIPLE
jgi:hypothetical protein